MQHCLKHQCITKEISVHDRILYRCTQKLIVIKIDLIIRWLRENLNVSLNRFVFIRYDFS